MASQEELRQKLQDRGIDATQATISRDLKELGLVKRAGDGAYVRPGAERGGPAISEQLRRAVDLARAGFERVDRCWSCGPTAARRRGWPSGSTARSWRKLPARSRGDDTILLVCRGAEAAVDARGAAERW